MDNIIFILEKILLAIIPSLGFGILFNVPLRALKYCALLGAIGYGARLLLIFIGMHIEWASFCAAILVGWIGIECSRKWLLAHPKVFTVAAIIPMFPGINAYMAMTSAVKLVQVGYDDVIFQELVTNFLSASFIVGALSIGLSLPGIWLYRIRRNNI